MNIRSELISWTFAQNQFHEHSLRINIMNIRSELISWTFAQNQFYEHSLRINIINIRSKLISWTLSQNYSAAFTTSIVVTNWIPTYQVYKWNTYNMPWPWLYILPNVPKMHTTLAFVDWIFFFSQELKVQDSWKEGLTSKQGQREEKCKICNADSAFPWKAANAAFLAVTRQLYRWPCHCVTESLSESLTECHCWKTL